MCGACRTGGAAAPWEDLLAGAGPAQRAARAAAANRLLAGGRLRVSTWRGGYVLTAATGGAHLAASLDDLWSATGLPQAPLGPASGGAERWAWARLPDRWDVQAALVWVSAAVRGGAVTDAVLPAMATDGDDLAEGPIPLLRHGSPVTASHASSPDQIGVLGPDPGDALRRLVVFASAVQTGRRPWRSTEL
jgi:hypothetical protein